MKFLSGGRNRSVTYTIRPHRANVHPITGARSEIPAIRAEFKEHQFDSEAAAKSLGWNELDRMNGDEPGTTRKMVEQYLLEHADWGRADGRGIFHGEMSTLQELELRAKGVVKRCIFQQDAGDGQLQMCNAEVEDPENDFCDTHQKLVEDALAAQAGHAGQELDPPEPVEANA